MFEKRIGQTNVAFGVFEIDWVYFVRHGRRANFTRLDLLLEVVHGDVGPHVAIEVEENVVDALHAIKNSSQLVVVFNLGGGLGAL